MSTDKITLGELINKLNRGINSGKLSSNMELDYIMLDFGDETEITGWNYSDKDHKNDLTLCKFVDIRKPEELSGERAFRQFDEDLRGEHISYLMAWADRMRIEYEDGIYEIKSSESFKLV